MPARTCSHTLRSQGHRQREAARQSSLLVPSLLLFTSLAAVRAAVRETQTKVAPSMAERSRFGDETAPTNPGHLQSTPALDRVRCDLRARFLGRFLRGQGYAYALRDPTAPEKRGHVFGQLHRPRRTTSTKATRNTTHHPVSRSALSPVVHAHPSFHGMWPRTRTPRPNPAI